MPPSFAFAQRTARAGHRRDAGRVRASTLDLTTSRDVFIAEGEDGIAWASPPPEEVSDDHVRPPSQPQA